MNIASLKPVTDAHEGFRAAWQAKYPGTEPPALYPARPFDPQWQEADQMMDLALAQTYTTLANDNTYKPLVTAQTWTASAGSIGCPNNHAFSMSDTYCPHCGAGPVPSGIKWDAEQAAIRLGEKAGIHLLRLGL